MAGLSSGRRMRTTRALGATADDGGAAPGAAGSGFAALDSEFGSPPSTMSSCDFGWESAFEPTVESNDPCSPNDAVSEWSPRIPDPQKRTRDAADQQEGKRNPQLAQQTRRRTEKPELGMRHIGMFHHFLCKQR